MSNADAFARAAAAVRQIVDNCGGVCVIDRETLWDDVVLSYPSLRECSLTVKGHLTLSFRSVDLASRSYGDGLLIIYDTGRHDEDTARHAYENAREEELVLA